MEKEYSYLAVRKGEHIFLFKYDKGGETDLFFCLIEFGKNKTGGLSLRNVLDIIRKISECLRKGKRKCSFEIQNELEIQNNEP